MIPDSVLEALTGRSPYRWQSDLLTDWLMAGRVPDALDVPTGLGKTSVMPIWLAARALAPGVGLARRLVYVVDRRAVVDQATDEADRLSERLGDGRGKVEPPIADLRRALGLEEGRRLAVSTLRGQFTDNREWLEDPSAPAIIVGTVDMIGSRLLFSGYGVGRKMRPVHAGLLGADTLIVLDEAHLVPPFEALVQQVIQQRSAQTGADAGAVPPLQLMSLSATGKSAGDRVFQLTPPRQEDPPVRKRLDATKRLRIMPEVSKSNLAADLARRAVKLGEGGGAVLVFCDSRDIARRVADILRAAPYRITQIELLVGERRVLERQSLAKSAVFHRFLPRQEGATAGDGPAFLIATSAGEVGVDLDADHMVCDLVSWERMVQRLGRVNRRAEPAEASIEVVPARFDPKDADADTRIEDKDGERLAALRRAVEQLPRHEEGAHDASPGAILRLRADPSAATILQAATTPEPLRPALTPALVEAWAMTKLKDHPGRPDVAPWIRGWVDDTPQTRVLWRREFPPFETLEEKARLAMLNAFFDAAPPHLIETLEAPTFRVVSVLKKRIEAWFKRRPKEGEAKDEGLRPIVALDAANEVETLFSINDLKETGNDALVRSLTGRTLVIDARLGGLDEAGLLDPDADTPPPTWDSEAVEADGRGWTAATLKDIGRRIRTVKVGDEPGEKWVREDGWPLGDTEESNNNTEELRVERWTERPSAGDAARSQPQGLDDHLRWTGEEAARIGAVVLSEPRLIEMLALSAKLHDLGKTRPDWQNAMGAPRKDRPWAKTTGRGADLALLAGYRHEFGSLRDADPILRAEIADPDLQDLALHLIAAHHGHARPVIRPHDPEEAPIASERRARETALRFARLQRRLGPWGLAWFEALLRAADWTASRRNTEKAH